MTDKLQHIKEKDPRKKPKHIAIIMDGNGRWAKERGEERVYGHQQGVQGVHNAIEGCGEAGIDYLTLYAFSTENWNRPKEEVNALTSLLVKTIHLELDNLMRNNVRLCAIGALSDMPQDCQEELNKAIETTAQNTGLTVTLALSYSGRWEIVEMAKKIAQQAAEGTIIPKDISTETVIQNLSTANIPDPDILIRTGGDFRVSNFLLWQIAYTEFFFSPTQWPDFNKDELWQIIIDFMSRERRFGKTSEQVIPQQ
ncbi:isoprenyl transferase [Bacteroidales bacterium OttesenSCG-928-C03]|nr:isoprenyl transferase [Bacteroidales bacterium OttesenSCG-928-E04]MDL2309243.1 isoprenyl transferase [Bacteroidales bacterium OttesenSCG-928-C03]